MAVSVAELKAIADLNTKLFEDGLLRISGGVEATGKKVGDSFTSPLKAIAGQLGIAFSVGAIVSWTKGMVEASAETVRMAQVLNMASGELQNLKEQVDATGASGEGFQAKIVKMVDSQEDAITGNEKTAQAFARLGISMQELMTLSPDELLLRVAQGAQLDATAISDLNTIMGRGAAGEYGAALKDIAERGLPAVNEALSKELQQAAELDSQWKKLKNTMGDWGRMAVVTLAQNTDALLSYLGPLGMAVFQWEKLTGRKSGILDKSAKVELPDVKKANEERLSDLAVTSMETKVEEAAKMKGAGQSPELAVKLDAIKKERDAIIAADTEAADAAAKAKIGRQAQLREARADTSESGQEKLAALRKDLLAEQQAEDAAAQKREARLNRVVELAAKAEDLRVAAVINGLVKEQKARDTADEKRQKEAADENDRDLKEQGKNNEKIQEAQNKLDRARHNLPNAIEQANAKITVAAPQAADSLAKIGGIVGGQTDKNLGLLERQLKVQEETRDAVQKITGLEQALADLTDAIDNMD